MYFPSTKKSGQWLLFHLPVFNDLIVKTEVSRFSYNLAMLLNSGIPITKALVSLSNVHDYYMYKQYTYDLSIYINNGKSFHEDKIKLNLGLAGAVKKPNLQNISFR